MVHKNPLLWKLETDKLMILKSTIGEEMQDFKKLQVWQKSHDLTLRMYELTSRFPREEMYGLTNQIRRACASIPTNIAEGCGRGSSADFARFLHIAMGSANETEYLILLARDLKYLDTDLFVGLMDTIIEVRKMLTSLLRRLKTTN